ncbi:MAG TPA: PAS domain-containing protein [Steroidobacteraceae bacterium]|jgi:diguanylate cyclase (GGDEF)-like protein/PAS domain S-box-containing protein
MGRRLKLTVVVLCGALAALILAIFLFASQARLVRDAEDQQASFNGWQGKVSGVIGALADAETSQRAYLLTGRERYLTPYRKALAQMPTALASLEEISRADPTLPDRIRDVQTQARLKLAELAETIRLFDSGQKTAALDLVETDAGERYMDQLRDDAAAVGNEIRARRNASMARVASGSVVTQRLAMVTVSVLVITVILAGVQITLLMASHRRSEEALAANERFVRAVTDNIPVRLAYFDRKQRFQFINQVVCNRFGKSREEFLGHTLAEVVPGGAESPIFKHLPSALNGHTQRFEYSDAAKTGDLQIETTMIPDFDADGGVRGVFAFGTDITHRISIERALRDLTEVFDNTSDYVAQADARGKVLYMNPSARRAVGLSHDARLTGHTFEFFSDATNQRWQREILPAVECEGVWVGETAVVVAGGRQVPVNHMVIAHRDSQGRIARYSSILRDISVELAARQELAKQTATLNAVVDAIPDMIAVLDLDLRCRLVNTATERWRGKRRETMLGRTFEGALGTAEYERSQPWLKRALAGEVVHYEKDYPEAADSRYVAITYLPLRLDDGTVGGLIVVAQDITRQREENLRLLSLSERDPLTGLLNRAGFEGYLDQRTSRGEGAGLAVIYIDLDHFKPVNDAHGHAAGDSVLKEVASRLLGLVRPTDAVARLGGDEFGVVLAGVREAEHASRVADKIVEMARHPIRLEMAAVVIGASVGVAFDSTFEGGWKGLVARADKQAYEAKAAGRGRQSAEAQTPTMLARALMLS